VTHRERFAPSPTGPLHLGHAFSAITAWNNTIASGGTFLVRIEDVDQSRARPEWEHQIYDDLNWLGLDWPEPVLRQSERADAYSDALNTLWDQGLLYPEGDCPKGVALRLNIAKAVESLSNTELEFTERSSSLKTQATTAQSLITTAGDIVLARKDMGTSYHLSVVLDDAYQNITHVTRGEDLYEATPIHVLLQRLLNLPTPIYHHHALIRDDEGKRLAKRDDARAIQKYRKDGAMPQDIYDMIGITPLVRT